MIKFTTGATAITCSTTDGSQTTPLQCNGISAGAGDNFNHFRIANEGSTVLQYSTDGGKTYDRVPATTVYTDDTALPSPITIVTKVASGSTTFSASAWR